MPSSTLRRSAAGLLRPQNYPTARSPWLHFPQEVEWSGTSGTAITPGASNTKSSYVEVIASTGADFDALLVNFRGSSAPGASHPVLLDVATGGAGSEVDVIPNIQVGYTVTTAALPGTRPYLFPISIPAGTRISVRAQDAHATPVASEIVLIGLRLPFGSSPTSLVNHGADTATSRGVAVTANDTWTEVVASTTVPYQGLTLTIGGNNDTAFATSGASSVSLGIGAAAAEVEILRAIIYFSTNEIITLGGSPFAFFASRWIPPGTRVAVKSPVATNNQLDAVLIGIPVT